MMIQTATILILLSISQWTAAEDTTTPPNRLNPICLLPSMEEGWSGAVCLAYFPSYSYHSKTGKCVRWIYGGCGGNENRFGSAEECQRTCDVEVAKYKTKRLNPICLLPSRKRGPCRARMPRFSYNSRTGKCVPFKYGGCRGNTNRFGRLEDCQNTCGLEMAEDKTKRLKTICLLPSQKSGPCRARMPRFSYDSRKGKCVPFNYGGCKGNANRFGRLEDCQNTCGLEMAKYKTKRLNPICLLPSRKRGPCRARMPRFSYNSRTGKCVPFNYGGCRGNDNRFGRLEDCKNTCGLETAEDKTKRLNAICLLPSRKRGPCRARMPRFSYNSRTGKCVPFNYGGCRGNANRFRSFEDCQMTCAV